MEAKELRNDPDINTAIQYVTSDYCPVIGKENSNISKYLRHWKNLFLSDGILYRNAN